MHIPKPPLIITRPDHLSASTLNSFIDRRPQWFLDKVLHEKASFSNPSFARGKAVEHGLSLHFLGKGFNDCIDNARELYVEEIPEYKHMKNGPEYMDQLEGLLLKAIEATEEYGIPSTAQESFTVWLNDWKFLGFLDYKYGNEKIIIDLKTSNKTPSQLSLDYKRQGTVYKLGYPGYKVIFLFVVPLKSGPKAKAIELTNKDVTDVMPLMCRACRALDSFYDMFDGVVSDKRLEALKDLFMPSPNDMWNASDVNHSMRIFGINESDRLKVEGQKIIDSDKTIKFEKGETCAPAPVKNPFKSILANRQESGELI